MDGSIQLVALSGPHQGQIYPLDRCQTFVLGRGNDSHSRIPDPLLSRIHCRIDWINDQPWLIDAGSSSGTFLNGKKIDRHPLQHGDQFDIGNSSFRFDFNTPSSSPPKSNPAANSLFQPQPAKPHPHRLEQLVGQKCGPFRLDRVLAEGSSSVVFKATDTEQIRTAAVKILEPDLDHHDEQKERFVRAMKTMLNVRHPHIVSLFGAGKQGRFCWAAMEFIEGDSLAKVIELIGIGDLLPWREAFRVAVQIGRALDAANFHKLIHRNVTPKNILRRNHDSCYLLGDLMLAKALEGHQAHQVTRAGQIVGELPFLPPERTVDHATVDSRSDLYGLGATLYALVSGKPPAIGRSLPEVIQAIRNTSPPRLTIFQKDIDPDFEKLILQLLEKNPDLRYQSAKLLLHDLERIGASHRLNADAADWVD